MLVVIQCAARKREEAGHLRTRSGRPVMFVARPEAAPPSDEIIYAHPDAASDSGQSWRERLLEYNSGHSANPLGLSSAIALYGNPTYGRLARRVDAAKLFILSAGWGLIPSAFLTPNYDITFTASAEPWKRRLRADRYHDLMLLPDNTDEPVIFFGGKDYVPLFVRMTQTYKGQRTIYYNSRYAPDAAGCKLVRFSTTRRTNWHYECAEAWLDEPGESITR